MSDLIDTTEMYLRTIYELIEDGIVPMRARIAEHLGHSGPTVSQTVARMERDGLVVVTGDRHLELTEEGLMLATRVMRKHRLAELLLTNVIGLDLAHVHEEACRWEHVMSDRVERRLLEMLGDVTRSPYGNAIPGLAELGRVSTEGDKPDTMTLRRAAELNVTNVIVTRIGEVPQAVQETMEAMVEVGVVPGATVAVRGHGGGVSVTTEAGTLVFDETSSRHVFVRGLP